MNKYLQQMLSKFRNNKNMEQFQLLMARLRAAQKPDRKYTYKPAFTCGFRGWPRTMTKPGSVPAPTIDQVRLLEQAYMSKLHVKQGLIYFKDGTPFTHERGQNYRHSVMENIFSEVN